jgi:mxaJ protein
VAVLVPLIAGSLACGSHSSAARRELAVCSDPNNMPFSNARGEGFENKIAELVAHAMHASLRYEWAAQRRGFIRTGLRAGLCDVIIGVPSSFELVRATRPYYRSSYMFVTQAARGLHVTSLDDPSLHTLRIGVHVVGDDYGSVPPAQALATRGVVKNIVGYSIYGDYSQPNPPARLIEAVAKGEIDVALAWGPLAGYFAKQSKVPLTLEPVSPEVDLPFVPLVFDISMGVRREDTALQEELDGIIGREGSRIDEILREYGVPFRARVRR